MAVPISSIMFKFLTGRKSDGGNNEEKVPVKFILLYQENAKLAQKADFSNFYYV